MVQLNLIALSLDRIASFSPKRAQVRAERLSKVAPERAFALFAVAAVSGDVESAFIVGEHYLEGNGVHCHPIEAGRWYRRAAEAGHVRAQCRLAQLHLLGVSRAALEPHAGLFEPVGPGPDYEAAIFWAQPAAESGAPDAQAMLAYILSSGPLELRDSVAASEWYCKSAMQNYPQGHLGYAIDLMSRADSTEKISAARENLFRAAEAGLPVAHYLLGLAAEEGHETVRDEAAARAHYRIAAEAGLVDAQRRLGRLLFGSQGGPADPLNGESWLRRAALQGDLEAAASLGDFYARGGDRSPNYVEATRWLRAAADGGDGAAARTLGSLYLSANDRDPDEAVVWFKRAAAAGHQGAQADLASLIQTGSVSSLASDPPPVHEWFERAARQGDPVAAFNYAVCLIDGVGVPRNEEQAAFWLRRAADSVVTAQYWYGRMLADGRGVPKDDKEAVAWFARAAEAGNVDALVALAEHLLNGRGVPKDNQFANTLFLRAALAGHPGAMFALGMLYDGGHDSEYDRETDHREARRWFVRAGRRSHPMAVLMLARYAKRGVGGRRSIGAARRWYAYAALLGEDLVTEDLATLDLAPPIDVGH